MYRVSVGTMLCNHRRSFATLLDKEVCEWLYISPHTLQDYRDRKIIPDTQFAGKIIYKASDLEWLLEEKYKVQAGEYSLYLIGIEGDGVVITVQELFITDHHIPHIPHYSSTICLNRLQSLCRLYLLAHPLGTKITHFFAFTPPKV